MVHLTIFFVYYNFIWEHNRLKTTVECLSGLAEKAYVFKDLFEMIKEEFICGY